MSINGAHERETNLVEWRVEGGKWRKSLNGIMKERERE